MANVPQLPPPRHGDLCWSNGPGADDWAALGSSFPILRFTFSDGPQIDLEPINYLFVNAIRDRSWCLGEIWGGAWCALGAFSAHHLLVLHSHGRGFNYRLSFRSLPRKPSPIDSNTGMLDNYNQGTILGSVIFRNVIMTFDNANRQLRMTKVDDCTALKLVSKSAGTTVNLKRNIFVFPSRSCCKLNRLVAPNAGCPAAVSLPSLPFLFVPLDGLFDLPPLSLHF